MPIPVISIAQMREWEAATWATGQTEVEVIRRVGKRVVRRARKLTRAGDTILFLVGKGHNGDDARAAAKQLEGRRAEVLEMFLPDTDLLPLESALKEKPALIVDGLFRFPRRGGKSSPPSTPAKFPCSPLTFPPA